METITAIEAANNPKYKGWMATFKFDNWFNCWECQGVTRNGMIKFARITPSKITKYVKPDKTVIVDDWNIIRW